VIIRRFGPKEAIMGFSSNVKADQRGLIEKMRKDLLDLIVKKSFRYRSDPPFKLVSGRESPYYIDCKPTSNNAEGLTLIGEIIFDLIRDLDAGAIGGLTMGADPIAHAASMVSYQKGKPINSFCVRSKPKDHGTTKMVEGDVQKGDRVIILDDVITTGGSTIRAIEAAEDFGLQVVKVVVLVDREEGGKETIEKLGPKVEAVFTLTELKALAEDESTLSNGESRDKAETANSSS
jgi:orotate phosphoribosyltransferase